MSTTALHTLRYQPLRGRVALLAVVALFLAGLAQAAHFHKSDPARGSETHLQCLLCLHADRWAGPSELPSIGAPVLSGGAIVVIPATVRPLIHSSHRYEARGPPRV